MTEKKLPDVQKNKSVIDQLEEAMPYALNIILQSLQGFNVNRDKVKDARFAMADHRGRKILEKENRKVDNADRRFNFKVVELYGSEENKKMVKALVKKSFGKMKFIEE